MASNISGSRSKIREMAAAVLRCRCWGECPAPDDIVWVHDYHLIPMVLFLRQMGCSNRVGFFLHIPWPAPDVARAMPAYQRILRSFGAYDVVGFQTEADADNFRDCIVSANAGRVISADLAEPVQEAIPLARLDRPADPGEANSWRPWHGAGVAAACHDVGRDAPREMIVEVLAVTDTACPVRRSVSGDRSSRSAWLGLSPQWAPSGVGQWKTMSRSH
jgi:hypothetical protein